MPGTSYGPYSYPLENRERYKSRIEFQAVRIDPPSFSSDFRFEVPETFTEFSINRQDIESRRQQQGNNYKRKSSVQINPMNTEILAGERADLYLPIALSIADRLNYETPNLNLAGAAALSSLQAGAGLVGSISESIRQGYQSVLDFLGAVSGNEISRVIAVRGSQSILGKALPESVRDAISIGTNVTMNPNTRAAFRAVGLREFTFEFKFIPKSQAESLMVKDIINFFRRHAYPEELAGIVALEYPNMFKIKMLYENEDGRFVNIGTPIKMCYLRSVSTVYNPTAQTFHSDGSPSEINMSLSFVEHKTLNRKDIENEQEFDETGINSDINPKPEEIYDYTEVSNNQTVS